MKRSLLALALVFAAGQTFAAEELENRVEINLKATVDRACFLDFDDGNGAAQVTVTSTDDAGGNLQDLQIQRTGRDAAGSDDRAVTVYETCNADYSVSIFSANGGLALDLGAGALGYVHEYSMIYTTSAAGLSDVIPSATATQAAPHVENRLLVDHDATGASSPHFKGNVLQLSFPKANDLPQGEYVDIVALEMGELQ